MLNYVVPSPAPQVVHSSMPMSSSSLNSNNSRAPPPPSSSSSVLLPTFDEALTTLVDIFIVNANANADSSNNSNNHNNNWTVEQLARILRSHVCNVDQACDYIINFNNNSNTTSGTEQGPPLLEREEEIVWCYDDETEWKRYNAYDAQVLETTYRQQQQQQQQQQQPLQHGCSLQDGKYRVDFGTSTTTTTASTTTNTNNHHRNQSVGMMTQTNTLTGHQRRVQRLDPTNQNPTTTNQHHHHDLQQQYQSHHYQNGVSQQQSPAAAAAPAALQTPPTPTTPYPHLHLHPHPYPQHVSHQHQFEQQRQHQMLLAQQQQPLPVPQPQTIVQQAQQQQQQHPNPTPFHHPQSSSSYPAQYYYTNRPFHGDVRRGQLSFPANAPVHVVVPPGSSSGHQVHQHTSPSHQPTSSTGRPGGEWIFGRYAGSNGWFPIECIQPQPQPQSQSYQQLQQQQQQQQTAFPPSQQQQQQENPITSAQDILKLYNNSSSHIHIHNNNNNNNNNEAMSTNTAAVTNTETPIVPPRVAPVPQSYQQNQMQQQQQHQALQSLQQHILGRDLGGDAVTTESVSIAAAYEASRTATTMPYLPNDSEAVDVTMAALSTTVESQLKDIETEIVQIQQTKESMKPEVCTELITKICCQLDSIDLTTTNSHGQPSSQMTELRKKRKELIKMAERIDPSASASTDSSTNTPGSTDFDNNDDYSSRNGTVAMDAKNSISASVSHDEELLPQLGRTLPIQPQQTTSLKVPPRASAALPTQPNDEEPPQEHGQRLSETPPSAVPSSSISAFDILQLYSIRPDTSPPPPSPLSQQEAALTTNQVGDVETTQKSDYSGVVVDDLLNNGNSVVNKLSSMTEEQTQPIQAVPSANADDKTDRLPLVTTNVAPVTSSNLIDAPIHQPTSHPPAKITSSSNPDDYNSMFEQKPAQCSPAEISHTVTLPPTATFLQQLKGQYHTTATARYGFSGDPSQKQISFPEGATLAINLNDTSEGWIRGQYGGHTGWLPIDYIIVHDQQDTHGIDAQADHPQVRYQQPQQEQQFEVATTAFPSTTLLPSTEDEEVSDFETMTVMGGHAENLNTRIALMTDHSPWQAEQNSSMKVKDSVIQACGEKKLQKSSKKSHKKDKKKGSSSSSSSKKSTKVAPDTKAKTRTKTKESSSTTPTKPRRVKTNDKKKEK